ncbi:hypothetical protein Dsin_022903 [Dipteronia sinensis]|uniref:Uncharacterized protein n=1 Tax=Dipteronia sinensis TaxID=43782 RepID=A0AAE0A2N7_9ROSI|nr:hypothetical protein Dsin_022903 [Dipteronia sinensis]
MSCVTSVRFSFLINCGVCCSVIPSRGLRQGDSRPPYLYLRVTQGLSGLISAAVRNDDLKGFQCNKSDLSSCICSLLMTTLCSLVPLRRIVRLFVEYWMSTRERYGNWGNEDVGMGFTNLFVFNRSLMAKQGWCMEPLSPELLKCCEAATTLPVPL